MAEFVFPMLLKSCPAPFDDDDFLFEFKFDGVRAVLDCFAEPIIYNRKHRIKTHLYPEITAAAKLIEKGTVLDGEIIAVDSYGKQNFYLLLERDLAKKYSPYKASGASVFFVAFDIMYYRGESVMDKPLYERKKLLDSVVNAVCEGGTIRPALSCEREGKMLYDAAEGAKMEGIVAKRKSGAYLQGVRSDDWLKIKCLKRMDVFVLGYTKKQSRISLLLGVKTTDGYRYIGNVSNGLKHREWEMLEQALAACASDENRLMQGYDRHDKDTVFTEPIVKVCVKFLEQDESGKLRQPIIEKVY